MAEPSPIAASPIEMLPSELVAHIAVLSIWGPDHSSSLKDFSALARTSGHFYSILNPLLYQHNFKHDQPYESCVLWAADHGNIDTLKRAHSYGADLNIDGSRDDSDFTIPLYSLPGRCIATALHISILNEDIDMFSYLLDENVDIEVPSWGLCPCKVGGDRKTYPLHEALHPGKNPRFAQELIAKGAYRVAKRVPAITYMEQEEGHGKAAEHLLRRSEPLAMAASLQYALRKKRPDLVRELLEKEADITYRNPASGETALHVALDGQDADLEVLKLLLAHPETPLDIMDNNGHRPIHICASQPALVGAMKLLLAHPNIDPLASDTAGDTALDIAAKYGSAPMFSLLMRHPRVDLNDEERWSGDQPLNLALQYIVDNVDIVKYLLAQPGSRVSLPGRSMMTPLHICAANPALLEVAKLLQAHPSFEPSQGDISGATPLLYAVKYGSIPMIELLLSQPEVNVSTADHEGLTPLHVCAASPALFEVAKRLLADPNVDSSQGDGYGATPLFYAAKSGSIPMIELLLTQPGINVSAATHVGQTPLHACAANPERIEATKVLLAHPDIQTTVTDRHGMSPLGSAAESGSIAMFDLIANRPEVDICSLCADGRNVLHIVCSSPETEESKRLAEYLLDRGVPIGGGLEACGSPLYCAIREQNFDIALMLLSRGADPNSEIDASHHWGPLHHLLWKPHPRQTELLRELLAKGVEVDRQTVQDQDDFHGTIVFESGGTPLIFALVGANNVECMKLLLDAGANADAMAVSMVHASGVYQGGKQSMLAALFREKFQSFTNHTITEENVESIEEGIMLLLERGTSIGPVGEGPSALDFASDAAHYSDNWALLNLLVECATIENIDPDYVNLLYLEYEPEAIEVKPVLARFQEKLLADLRAEL